MALTPLPLPHARICTLFGEPPSLRAALLECSPILMLSNKTFSKKLAAFIIGHLCFVPAKQRQHLLLFLPYGCPQNRGKLPQIVREYRTNRSENNGSDGSIRVTCLICPDWDQNAGYVICIF